MTIHKLIRKIKFRIQIIFGYWHCHGKVTNKNINNITIISTGKLYVKRSKGEKVPRLQ